MTSRSESRSRDNDKVDLINQDEHKNGRLPVNFQCKTTSKGVNYVSLLNQMPMEMFNCILHRYTEKSEKGRFISKGDYAIMKMDDFINLIEQVYVRNNSKSL